MKNNDINRTQHFTTNFNYICKDLVQYIPTDAQLIEPFVGDGMLLNLFPNNQWEKYDLDPHCDCIQQDTLLNPPDYKNKYVITNPPYLARNKANDKQLFDKYNLDDLYKIAMHTILDCSGGILIIPTNFFSDNYSENIRKEFLNTFIINQLNVFTQPIFESTTYSICAFAFTRKIKPQSEQTILTTIYPEEKVLNISINEKYGYRFGGELFSSLEQITPIFSRLQLNRPPQNITHFYLTTIDSRIMPFGLSYNEQPFYGKTTDRTYATLIANRTFTEEDEKKYIQIFNKTIADFRNKYGNLVFTNYRDYNRKRIEFDFAYKLLTKIINEDCA